MRPSQYEQAPGSHQGLLKHILHALRRAQRYSARKVLSRFQVGKHPEIPLEKIYGTRNRITHAYKEVDIDVVWNLASFGVPDLLPKIVAALTEFKIVE